MNRWSQRKSAATRFHHGQLASRMAAARPLSYRNDVRQPVSRRKHRGQSLVNDCLGICGGLQPQVSMGHDAGPLPWSRDFGCWIRVLLCPRPPWSVSRFSPGVCNRRCRDGGPFHLDLDALRWRPGAARARDSTRLVLFANDAVAREFSRFGAPGGSAPCWFAGTSTDRSRPPESRSTRAGARPNTLQFVDA